MPHKVLDETATIMAKTYTGITPERFNREGTTIIQLAQVFPNESTAIKWFELIV